MGTPARESKITTSRLLCLCMSPAGTSNVFKIKVAKQISAIGLLAVGSAALPAPRRMRFGAAPSPLFWEQLRGLFNDTVATKGVLHQSWARRENWALVGCSEVRDEEAWFK